jgi:glycosidase
VPAGAEDPAARVASRRCALDVGFRRDTPELAKAAAAEPRLVGSWDGFAAPAAAPFTSARASHGDGAEWITAHLPLGPGRYRYAIVVGDALVLDELNPRTGWAADPRAPGSDPLGTEVSEVEIADCSRPALAIVSATGGAEAFAVEARFERGFGGAALDAGAVTVELARGGQSIAAPAAIVDGDFVRVRAGGLLPGKYTVRLGARDVAGAASDPALASAFVEERPGRALADGLVYEVIVDRFRGPSGALAPPESPGDRAGGTLDGLRAAVEDGYFDRLGVSTLWVSPLYQNPPGRWIGSGGHLYEAYHGYWPAAPRTVEPLLGGEPALDALVDAAHARGLRVVLDVVPHHVHLDHEYWRDHSRAAAGTSGASWFLDGPSACVCGAPGCSWLDRIEDCWFAPYLPDLNWHLSGVVDVATGDLAWWQARFDLDGLRVDAVPMMPRSAQRAIVRTTHAAVHREGLDQIVLGEVYTGPGDIGRTQIRYYLGGALDGLDSAFDFPLAWQARAVLARGESTLASLESELAAGDQAFAGSGAVMARFLDNHDVSRFVSEAAGDGANDPWSAPAAQPSPWDDEPYARTRLGLAWLLTLPGLPVLYYGDEVALAGAGDPDARRVLPDVLAPDALPAELRATLDLTARLGRLRRCAPALRGGKRRIVYSDADRLILALLPQGGGDPALLVLSRARDAAQVTASGLPALAFRDALSGTALDASSGSARVSIAPLAAAVYLPEGSSCAE